MFRLSFKDQPYTKAEINAYKKRLKAWWKAEKEEEYKYLLIEGSEANSAYQKSKDEIKILYKNGEVLPLSMNSEFDFQAKVVKKYFVCHPKLIGV